MKTIKSFQEAMTLWSNGKNRGQKSITNFFLSRAATERAVKKSRLLGTGSPGASIILREDRDFYHLYVNYSDSELLSSLLENLTNFNTLVVDVIQRHDSHKNLIALLSNAHFHHYRELVRLNRPRHDLPDLSKGSGVSLANESDAALILQKLEDHFDRFSEQLPDLDEIFEAITAFQVIVCRVDDEIAGFLFLESLGKTSKLRYWFVESRFRGQSIGSALMRHYLSVSAPNTDSQLWVVKDNLDAISKYHNYGYMQNELEDRVMIRR